jgi:hypothetical protein
MIKMIKCTESCLLVISKNNRIYRWRYAFENELKVVEVGGRREKMGNISKIYADYKGFHAVICENDNYYYLSVKESKLRCISSWKGMKISSLAFNESESIKNEMGLRIVYFERNVGLFILKM